MNKKSYHYFIQYWSFENPTILTSGKLLDVLFERWDKEWNKIPDCVEGKIRQVGLNFEFGLVGKKYFKERRKRKNFLINLNK